MDYDVEKISADIELSNKAWGDSRVMSYMLQASIIEEWLKNNPATSYEQWLLHSALVAEMEAKAAEMERKASELADQIYDRLKAEALAKRKA